MLRLREMRSVLEKAKTQGVSMQRRLVLYWFSMALAILAAVLLVVSLTGCFPTRRKKFGQSLTIQKHNTASALAGQMDQLTAQSIAPVGGAHARAGQAAGRRRADVLRAQRRSRRDRGRRDGALSRVEHLFEIQRVQRRGLLSGRDGQHGAAGRGDLARGAVPALFGAARHRCDGPARHVLSRHGGDGAQRAGADAQPLESGAERAGRPRLHAAAARIGRPPRRALPVDGAHRPARHVGVGDAAVRAAARQRGQCARHLRRGAQRPVFSPHLSRRGQCLRQHGHGARPHRRRPAAARTGHDRQPRRVVSHGRRHAHVQDRPVL